VWSYGAGNPPKKDFAKKHDTIFRYAKTENYIFNTKDKALRVEFNDIALKMHFKPDDSGRLCRKYPSGRVSYADEGKVVTTVWADIDGQQARSPLSSEYLGYPTQKPKELLRRIILASSNEGGI
jgi:DNA modification methylase